MIDTAAVREWIERGQYAENPGRLLCDEIDRLRARLSEVADLTERVLVTTEEQPPEVCDFAVEIRQILYPDNEAWWWAMRTQDGTE